MILMWSFYSSGDTAYNETIRWRHLFEAATHLDFKLLPSAISVWDWGVLILQSTAIIIWILSAPQDDRLIVSFSIMQLLLLYHYYDGLVLLLVLPFELLQQLDGEWFAEHTPTRISAACWVIGSFIVIWLKLKNARVTC